MHELSASRPPTDPANLPMRTVFERLGWELVGGLNEFDGDWVMYAITRPAWELGVSAEAGARHRYPAVTNERSTLAPSLAQATSTHVRHRAMSFHDLNGLS